MAAVVEENGQSCFLDGLVKSHGMAVSWVETVDRAIQDQPFETQLLHQGRQNLVGQPVLGWVQYRKSGHFLPVPSDILRQLAVDFVPRPVMGGQNDTRVHRLRSREVLGHFRAVERTNVCVTINNHGFVLFLPAPRPQAALQSRPS